MWYKVQSFFFGIAVLFALGIGIGRCADEPNATVSSTAIMPLTIGNSWVYTTTSFDTGGVITSKVNSVVKVISKSTNSLNSERYTVVTDGIGPAYGLRGGTLFLYFPSSDSDSVAVAKFPARARDTIQKLRVELIDSTIRTAEAVLVVVNTDTLISVSAGSFHCQKYHHEFAEAENHYLNGKTEYYYSPGVGMVAEVHFDWRYNDKFSGKRVSWRRELQSFQLK